MEEEYGVELTTDLKQYIAGLEKAVAEAKTKSAEIKAELSDIEVGAVSSKAEENLTRLSEKARQASADLQDAGNNLDRVLKGGIGKATTAMTGSSTAGSMIKELAGTAFKSLGKAFLILGAMGLAYKLIIKRVKEWFELKKKINDGIDKTFKLLGKGALELGKMSFEAVRSFFNKSLNAYLSFDKEISQSIQNTWAGFGSFLAPILEYIASLFQKLLAYVNATVKVFTGIDFVARANTKAMNGMATATNKVNKALSGFDELNNIAQESGSGGGGITGSTIELPDVDVSGIESIAEKIKQLIEEDNWFEVGTTLRDKIIGVLNGINWEDIKKGAKEIGKNFAETLNGLMTPDESGETLGKSLGRTLAEALNTGLKFAQGFLETIDWVKFVNNIFDFIITTINTIDFDTLTKVAMAVAKGLNKALKTALKRLRDYLPDLLGKIKDYMKSQEFADLLTDLGEIFENIESIKEELSDFIYEIYGYYKKREREERAKANEERKNDIKEKANDTFDTLSGENKKGFNSLLEEAQQKSKEVVEGAGKTTKEETKKQTDLLTPEIKKSGMTAFGALGTGIKDTDLSSTIKEKATGMLTTLGMSLGSNKGENSEFGKIAKNSMTSFVDVLKNSNVAEASRKIAGDVTTPMNQELQISGSTSNKTKSQGLAIVNSFLGGLKNVNILAGIKNIFGPISNLITTLTTGAKTVAETCGRNVANALIQGLKSGIVSGVSSIVGTITNSLNNIIRLFNRVADNISRNFNVNATATIGIGDVQQKLSARISSYIKSIPFLKIGTNEVYKEGLAYLHAGERVVPADVAKGGYSADNEETNELLRQLIATLEDKDFSSYISVEDIGRASVNYINDRKRIIGEAII